MSTPKGQHPASVAGRRKNSYYGNSARQPSIAAWRIPREEGKQDQSGSQYGNSAPDGRQHAASTVWLGR
jgi:hypothetical protein